MQPEQIIGRSSATRSARSSAVAMWYVALGNQQVGPLSWDDLVSYDVQFVGKVKTALFGGEGLFFATLTGPGRVWLQSLPFSRLADRISKAIPRAGRGRQGEGSVLDHAFGLGNLIDGDG